MLLHGCLCLLAVSGLLAAPLPRATQTEAGGDADVTRGVRLVEAGDYDAGILALDTAARRLAADPARARELSRAYVFLGIAYLGKGHEAAARAKFRDAVASVRDLTLSPEEFPPKVIDLFESARAEVVQAPPSAAPAAASPSAPAAKKGGSKTLLVVGGLGGAAAVAGIALAGGGGDGGSAGANSSPATTKTEDLSGFLPATEGSRHFSIVVQAAGSLVAELSWTSPPGQAVELVMQLFDAAGRDVMLSNRTSPNAAVLRANVNAQKYDLSVFYAGECPGCEAQFRLMVTHP